MGQGIITVSKALFERQEPTKGPDGEIVVEAGDPIKRPETLAEWHAFMMLPEEYHLLEAKMDPMYPYWHLTVECEAIPSVEGKLPEVSPIYRVEGTVTEGTRKHYLDRIELNRYTSDPTVIWQRSKQ